MAIKTISQFPPGTPTDNDYILFEQNGEGKSAPLESLPIPTSVQNKLDTKVNYSDSLSYEEIMATNPVPDLTNKVASASALKNLIKINTVTVTTDSQGRYETYNFPRLINAFCVSPQYAYIKNIVNYNGIPALFYFMDKLHNMELTNTEVTIRFISY